MRIPKDLTRDHVLAALSDWQSDRAGGFRPSSTYDLVHDGARYPPKAVLGLALERLLGRKVVPRELSGGDSTNRVLERLGFEVVRRDPR